MSGIAAGERRIVSVLVADVADSTAIGERLGPERSKFLFDEVVGLMRAEVERFGGTVAQLTGDGVLALFGAPTAHEDDSERAVRAALTLTEAVRRYAVEVGEAYRIELSTRVAVNTGPVVVPQGDASPDLLYNALGDTVNVAARLQALGDIVLGPATARQVEDAFELEPLGDVELKGKAEPVSAFRAVGVREKPRRAPVTPLVGRDAELAVLVGVLELNVVPEVAEEIRVSRDGLTYRIRLRRDATWSDGAPVVAQDFVRAMEEFRRGSTAFTLDPVADALAHDERTLEIRMSTPTSYFPYVLGVFWNPVPARPGAVNGPFRLSARSEDRGTLVANPSWPGNRGNVVEAQVSFLADDTEAAAAWHSGRYDLAFFDVSEGAVPTETILERGATLSTTFIAFAAERPPFDNETLRRALAHASDPERIPVFSQRLRPARRGGLLPPAMPGHAHRLGLEYDVERAAKLLAEAGHPDGRDLPELRVAAAARPTALVEIGRQWRGLGIRCHFERLPLSEIADAVDRGAHLWLQGFVADFPDPDGFLPPVARVLDAYHGEIAAQLERARSLPDRDERLRLYQQVDRRLVREEVRVIPMWYGANITARRPWVRTWANALSDAQLDEVFVER